MEKEIKKIAFLEIQKKYLLQEIEKIKVKYPEMESDDYDNGRLDFKKDLLGRLKFLIT